MRTLSLVIYWCCNLVLFVTPLLFLLSVFETSLFTNMIRRSLNLQIQWHTVGDVQWIVLWCSMLVFIGIGYAGIYFLRKSFQNFAAGDWFSLSNSLNVNRFAKLLLVQSIATPILFTVSGLILSFNHPPGQKILALSFGTNEFKGVMVSIIFLVISHILVVGHNIDDENKHFL